MDLESLLDTTVSTASKFTEKLSDTAAVVTVVTQDELQRFGGTTLFEVLQRVAGTNVASDFLADTRMIGMRGDVTSPGHILFLINGRPVREVMEGGVSGDLLESFPVNILERIEVVKSPGSVLYGSQAFSGVIDLITKKAVRAESRFSSGEGAAGERSVNEDVMFRKGSFSFVEGGQYHEWPQWNVTSRAIGPSGAIASQSAAIREGGLGAYAGIDFKGLSFMSSYTDQEAPDFGPAIVADTRQKRGFANLGYALHATARWKMTFDLTYTRSALDAPQYPMIRHHSDETVLEWTNFVTLSRNDRLTFGTAYNHDAGLETSVGPTPTQIEAQGTRNASSAYAQYEHNLTDEWKLIGGVQANKIGAIAVNAVPRGGVVWTPSGQWTLRLLYGGAFSAPGFDATSLNDPLLKGNPALLPEKVSTVDAQVSYQNNRIQASLDYFYSRQTDLIILNVAAPASTFINDPRPVNFKGGEGEGKYYLKRDWFLIGSVLYQLNDSGSGGENLSPGAALIAKAGISYQSEKGVLVSVFDAYQGHSSGYGSTLNPPASAFHSVSLHARFDLSKHWMKNDARGMAIFVNADDLLNTPVWLPGLGLPPGTTLPVIRGRTAIIGLEVWQKKQ